MIVPYAHQETLASLDQAAALEMMRLAQRTDSVLRQVYAPQGINMGLNLGQAAGAGIAAHLHMHALPRWLGDSNFMTVVAETRVLPETLDITWQRLRDGFAGVAAGKAGAAPPGTL
jgi:ATP adenylyltransferase